MAVIPITITSNDRIAVIAPHPDDECIGVGGLLSLYPELCHVIVLTDGRQARKDIFPEEMRAIRKREFELEMRYAQVHSYTMLDYEDGALMQHLDCLKDIDLTGYSKIFIPSGDDNHPDHMAGYLCVANRIQQQGISDVEVFQYEVHVPFHDVTHMLDISSVIDNKMRLIQFHQSQLSHCDYDQMTKALAKYRACQYNYPEKYIETYLQTDISHAPLKQENLDREKTLQKYIQFYRLLIRWIAQCSGRPIARYLSDKGITKIAVYGYASIGQLLCRELLESSIEVTDVLDKRDIQISGVQTLKPEDGKRDTDAVVVTAVCSYDEIKAELEALGYKNILSLEKIVEELFRQNCNAFHKFQKN